MSNPVEVENIPIWIAQNANNSYGQPEVVWHAKNSKCHSLKIQRVNKLIWPKEMALTGIAQIFLGKYNKLDEQESTISENFNEILPPYK